MLLPVWLLPAVVVAVVVVVGSGAAELQRSLWNEPLCVCSPCLLLARICVHKYTSRKRQGSGEVEGRGTTSSQNPPGHLAKIEIVNNEAFSIFVSVGGGVGRRFNTVRNVKALAFKK